MFKLTDFDYCLPHGLVAKYPLPQRSASRMLRLCRTHGAVSHLQIIDLPDLLSPNDLLVFNDTRVIPARLFGVKPTGGKVEILVERVLPEGKALAHIKGKSLKTGTKIIVENAITIEITGRQDNLFEVQFPCQDSIFCLLQQYGHIPLPHYMERDDEALDVERYQTVFARHQGAVAAPTAGLHFDAPLLQRLKHKGIEFAYVTLHVGAGTFQPVRTENITAHNMHAEYAEVSEQVCQQIDACKKRGGRVVAVGTTSVRSLETAAGQTRPGPFSGETNIFIYPGYQFRCVDALLTNFHLPKSTLLMLVSAFAGHENVMNAYQDAVRQQYRFFSYGDAMLII